MDVPGNMLNLTDVIFQGRDKVMVAEKPGIQSHLVWLRSFAGQSVARQGNVKSKHIVIVTFHWNIQLMDDSGLAICSNEGERNTDEVDPVFLSIGRVPSSSMFSASFL